MPDEETIQQAEQPAEEPKEEVIEVQGAGFIPGVPGMYANCRVVFDPQTKEVLRVEPLEGVAPTPAESTPEQPVSEPAAPAQPVEQSTDQVQESNGG